MKIYGWDGGPGCGLGACRASGRHEDPQNLPAGDPGRGRRGTRSGRAGNWWSRRHPPATKPYVGNVLNCTSCHLDDGEDPEAGSFIGVASAYPRGRPATAG